MHLHHIIPRHAGGKDIPHNRILLSVEDHAEAHRKRWLVWGQWQDKLAWIGLAGVAPHEDMAALASSMANKGKKASEATRKKQRERKSSLETKLKISIAHKGRAHPPVTEDTKRKLSAKLRGRVSNRKGAVLSDETRQRISVAKMGFAPWNKGKSASETAKRNQSEAHVGQKLSEDHKRKLSAATAAYWARKHLQP